MNDDQPRPEWDQDKADDLIGALVLVGVTYNEPGKARLDQFFGIVISAVENVGITLSLQGSRSGETFSLPPDVASFVRAKPGSYRLRSTQEVVEDPDYTSSWTITPPLN